MPQRFNSPLFVFTVGRSHLLPILTMLVVGVGGYVTAESALAIPPVGIPLGITGDVSSLNPVFVLTPDQVNNRLQTAKALEGNAPALAEFIARYQNEAKTAKGPADASGWTSVSGIDGNNLVLKSITRGADNQPRVIPITPPKYIHGLYAPPAMELTVQLESHYHKGGLNSTGRPATPDSATITNIIVVDDKGHSYPATDMTFFANAGTEQVKDIRVTDRSMSSTSLDAPITLQNGSPVPGGVSAEPTGHDNSTTSTSFSRETTNQKFYTRRVTCRVSLFNRDGSPRFGRDVRTITVRAITSTGEMDTRFDLKRYSHP